LRVEAPDQFPELVHPQDGAAHGDAQAGDFLARVRQPTLLTVGGRDPVVLQLHRAAVAPLAGETRLEIVPGATHLFTEPGALGKVARLATNSFVRHLQTRAHRPAR
jgi:pimeloyl-ACP methyl ester carboxylesterase